MFETASRPLADTAGSPEARLLTAGIVLPAARTPIANFVGGIREGELLFLSGQGPVTAEGKQAGKVGRDVSMDDAYRHARLAGLNLLTQMRAILGSLDQVSGIVKVFGMVFLLLLKFFMVVMLLVILFEKQMQCMFYHIDI